MEKYEVSLISLDILKWDLEVERMKLKLSFLIQEKEQISNLDLSITPVQDMVEEFINKFKNQATAQLRSQLGEESEITIEIANESFLRQKLHAHFKRVISDLNSPQRKKGQSRMISATHLDVYNENQDLSFLPSSVQFVVVLNWARRYYDKEDFQRAVEPLRRLIRLKPDYSIAYKWLARSLKKVRKYDEAMRYYEQYARVDQSLEAKLDLAKSYRKGKLFDKSETIYQEILQEFPADKEARVGMAQILYARQEKSYLSQLDILYEEDPGWLRSWLKEEFNFRIYQSAKIPLTPIQAAKYLGFEKAAELTQMAFRNEVPSHFNPSKARMNFYKEEIDGWSELMNRYQLTGKEIRVFPEALSALRIQPVKVDEEQEEENGLVEEKKPVVLSTRVEEIIRKIRENKARRQTRMSDDTSPSPVAETGQTPEKPAEAPRRKSVGRPRKISSAPDTAKENTAEAVLPQEKENLSEQSKKEVKKKRGKQKSKKSPNDPGTDHAVEIDLPNEDEFIMTPDKS